ncbi:squalene/phytoene synthase family protein [Legionella saoudiensis]|uniref:squalene/phytoene synthase family protein n=1 Tax=Legionella saoudiensis TaxID=1750561 RepID=UPI0007319EB8|nr:squalene/phytoene synthase family protein [Legionella saoudiensis]
MQQFSFYYQHLERVSRSFSFCISQLTSPEKEWVALSYLFLRIVDCIEDAHWHDKHAQNNSFATFKSFLIKQPSDEQFTTWLARFPAQIPVEEKLLLRDLPLLLDDKDKLPELIKNAMLKTITQMADGMHYFLNHYRVEDKIIFSSLTTTNQYCFFVAGIVGKLLSQIFTYVLADFKWTPELLNQSIHFGFFLQKVNLLKDKVEDETNGRYLIAPGTNLQENLAIHAHYALAYIKSIPILAGRPYRLFCAWSLFIGLASLRWLDQNGQGTKLKPRETYYLVNQISSLIDDNQALEKLFYSYLPRQENLNTPSCFAKQIPSWFKTIYDEEQDPISWLELGVIA